MNTQQVRFWSQWLQVASALFALQAVSWILLGTLDPFGIYERLLAESLFARHTLTDAERSVFAFANVLLGATTAGFFVMFFMLARIPFQRGERWSYLCLVVGLLTWFVLDSTFSLIHGATFNVLLVNVPCLVVLSIPLLATARMFLTPVRDRSEGRKTG
jgi:hypothetical protein